MTPTPDDNMPDDVSMAEITAAGLALDALAARAHGADSEPAGLELLLALQAEMLRAEAERDELRREVRAASSALDALAEGRGQDLPEVAALAALRAAIDRPAEVTPFQRVRRNPRRRRAVATLALAGVFSIGGVSAAAAASHPGDQLYSLRVAVIGRVDSDPVVSRDVLNAASSALATSGVTTSPTTDATETARSEKLLAQAASLVPQVKNTTVRKQLDARLAALTATLNHQMATRPAPSTAPGGPSAPSSATPIATPSGTASAGQTPTVTPTPGKRRHRQHPVHQHPSPTPRPSHSPRPHPRPTPGPSLSPTPAATPTASPTATPTPTRTRKTPTASPTPTGTGSATASPTPAPSNT